jgi:hypothetical protein
VCKLKAGILLIIKLHLASQIIVQKQQMYLGAKRTPPGKLPNRSMARYSLRGSSSATKYHHGWHAATVLLPLLLPPRLLPPTAAAATAVAFCAAAVH